MRGFCGRFADKYFGERLELRVKIFNAVMFIMAVTWTFGAFLSMRAARGESLAGIPALLCVGLVACLIWYANKSGNYKRCYWIMAVVMFMGQAGMAFFLNGGYKSGGVFAMLITNVAIAAFLFEGKKAIIVPSILIVEYAALCVYAYYYPDKINYFDEQNRFFSTVSILILTCVTISAVIILHLRLYDKQKRELELARQKAVEYEKMKAQFFAEMSHELRTPLTVIAASAQMVEIQAESENGKITEFDIATLRSINQEAMRLADMTNCALKTLTTPFDSGKAVVPQETMVFAPVYIGNVVSVIAGIVKPDVMRKGMALDVFTEDDVPPINGNADALIRLTLNFLHNAINHSGGKNIIVRAGKKSDSVILTIEDDGVGIPQELLPHVFERGVSGTGSTGLGLHICEKIVQAHGGDIKIENKSGGGVCITVTLPTKGVDFDVL